MCEQKYFMQQILKFSNCTFCSIFINVISSHEFQQNSVSINSAIQISGYSMIAKCVTKTFMYEILTMRGNLLVGVVITLNNLSRRSIYKASFFFSFLWIFSLLQDRFVFLPEYITLNVLECNTIVKDIRNLFVTLEFSRKYKSPSHIVNHCRITYTCNG